MDRAPRLPPSLRHALRDALERVGRLQAAAHLDEEEGLEILEELRAQVGGVLDELRSSGLPGRRELARPVEVASGILLHLTDPAQRDARGRLRDVSARLREALRAGEGARE